MKKIVSISFVLIYLLLSVGIAKSTHICMGREMNTSYFTHTAMGCFGVPIDKEKGCCSNELEVLKLEKDQQRANIDVATKQLYEIAPLLEPLLLSFLTPINTAEDLVPLVDPPPLIHEPLYQLNCSYTFYG